MLDKVSDFAGATNFAVLAVLTLIYKGTWYFRQVVLSALMVIWGLRLALFLLMRILQWGEDRRLDQIRGKLGKLAIFWTFQVIWAWTVSLPVAIVNASDHNPSVRGVDIIGWVMWLLGILCEAAADQQKLSFKNSPRNKGMWCNVRLWKYSRHPNYFGEILLWWGSFVAATPALIGAEWLVIFGPIFSTLLLLFATGIPFLEDSADKKYGNVYDYRQFKRVTSYYSAYFSSYFFQILYACALRDQRSSNFVSALSSRCHHDSKHSFCLSTQCTAEIFLSWKSERNQLQDASEQKMD